MMEDKQKLDLLFELIFSPKTKYYGAAKMKLTINEIQLVPELSSTRIWEKENNLKQIDIEIFFEEKSVIKEGYTDIEKFDIRVMLNIMERILHSLVLNGFSNIWTAA